MFCKTNTIKKTPELDFGDLGGLFTALAMLKCRQFSLVPFKTEKTPPEDFGDAGKQLPSSGAKEWTKLG